MRTITEIINFLENHIIECDPSDGCGRCDEARECVESLKKLQYSDGDIINWAKDISTRTYFGEMKPIGWLVFAVEAALNGKIKKSER